MQEQLLFTENVFTRLPMGVEIYDADGVLRRINDYAMKMYGVDDRAAVIGSVNLFKSPYCDEELQKRSGPAKRSPSNSSTISSG